MTRKMAVSLAAAALLAVGATGMAAVLGQLAVPLDGSKPAVAETNLGDLVADAIRAATEADFAFIQASALQPVSVTAGPIDTDQARSMLVLPDEPIVVLRLTGAAIKETLERSLALLPYPNKGFLQVSGLKVRYDPRLPAGARTLDIIVAAAGAPLDQGKTYRVAMPDSLARGALGYFRVFNSAQRQQTEITLIQALSSYVSAKSPVKQRVEGRIQSTQ